MSGVELVLGLLVVAVALALLAPRTGIPLPVLLVVGGLLLGLLWRLVPGRAVIHLPPDLVFFVFLPPLLVNAAYSIPLGAFRENLRPITLLAVGLVLATMGVVAELAVRLVPGMTRPAAYVLGAIVSPPDPVAATAVGRQLGLPSRLLTILEGEGLINDATALVAYRLALGAAAAGGFAWADAAGTFARSAAIGVGVGLAVGWGTAAVLRRIDDAVLETTVSLLVPYAAYLATERLDGSSVLAVVTLGFMLRHWSTDVHAAPSRLWSRIVWRTLDFLVSALVFILIGLELGQVSLDGASGRLLLSGMAICGAAIVVRLVWMFVVPLLIRLLPVRPPLVPAWQELLVLGWAGMRGVVSLAAALAVPATLGGQAFPARDALIVLTFVVLFGTLVLQGLTLPPLIRALGVTGGGRREAELEARRKAVRAGVAYLERQRAQGRLSEDEARELRRELEQDIGVSCAGAGHSDAYLRAREQALEEEREAVARLRDEGQLDEDVSRRLERELDIELVRLRSMAEACA